jgi:hypothetical protein
VIIKGKQCDQKIKKFNPVFEKVAKRLAKPKNAQTFYTKAQFEISK